MSAPFIPPLPPDLAERLSAALAVEAEAAILRLGHARKPSVALRIPAEPFRLVLKPTLGRSREGLLSATGEVDCELLHGDACLRFDQTSRPFPQCVLHQNSYLLLEDPTQS